jgi:hypothetical protein
VEKLDNNSGTTLPWFQEITYSNKEGVLFKSNSLECTSQIYAAIVAGQSVNISIIDKTIRTIQNTPYVIVYL